MAENLTSILNTINFIRWSTYLKIILHFKIKPLIIKKKSIIHF